MSKKVGFPVLSSMITGILFVAALALGTLTIFISATDMGPTTIAQINGLLLFVAALLAAIALLSYMLGPDLDDNQRYAVAIFLVLLILVLFNAGVNFSVSF